ncbi:MAG: hypothetical protein K0S70_700 [Microbacterium sp.]|nr:hypothetical protein [Microbacterium sp.]
MLSFMHLVKMCRRKRDKTAEDTKSPGDDAAELDAATVLAVDREMWVYARSVVGKLLAATLVATAATVSIEIAGLSFEENVTWANFDGEKALAAFSIIGLIVTALQVSVRSIRRAQVDPADGARQQFLRMIAFATMPVVLWLGFHVSWTSFLGSSGRAFDPVRVYGPLFFAIVLVLIAADAAAARPFDSSSPVVIEARRRRQLVESKRALRVLSRRTAPPSKRQWVAAILTGTVLILGQSALTAFATGVGAQPFMILVAAYLALLLAGSCQVAISSTLATARGRGASAALPLAATVAIWLFLGLIVLSTALAVSTTEDWQQKSATALLIFVAITGSDAVAVIILMGIRRGRRFPLRDVAVKSESKRLARNRHTLQPRDVPSMQARVALLLSPFFPLGLLVAQPAFSELREHPHPPTRNLLRRVVVISTVSGGIAIVMLFAAAVGLLFAPQ